MNREELNILYKFFNARQKVNMLGTSDYGAIIYLINEDLNIVDNMTSCVISCLDYAIRQLHVKEDNCYDTIVNVLKIFRELDDKYDRDTIKINDFLQLVKERLGVE